MYALRVKLVDPNAKIPTKSSEGAAGLDLYAAHDLTIKISCARTAGGDSGPSPAPAPPPASQLAHIYMSG
jgi:hypothetical protein